MSPGWWCIRFMSIVPTTLNVWDGGNNDGSSYSKQYTIWVGTSRRYRILVILGAWDKIPFNRKSWAGIRSQPLQELNLGYCPSSGFIEMRDKMINYLVPDQVYSSIRTTYYLVSDHVWQRIRTTYISCPRSSLTKNQDNIPILSQIKFHEGSGQHIY